MDSTTIQNKIYELVERLDKLIPEWSKSKANHNYCTDMKAVVLNLEKKKSPQKTAIAREEDAYCSEEYKKYLWKSFEIDCTFYSLDGTKGLFEKELDAMRSLLSFERNLIDKTK